MGERRGEVIEIEEGFHAGFEDGGQGMQATSKVRMAPTWQPARKQDSQSYNHRELFFAKTWMSVEADSSPDPEPSPASTLILAFDILIIEPLPSLPRRFTYTTMT